MRHQAEHVEALGIDAGDRIQRAVAVRVRRDLASRIAVAEGDAALALEAPRRLGVGEVVALAMRDADLDRLAARVAAGEGGVGALDLQVLPVADEAQIGVAHQDAGQEAGFAQDLEAVADAEHESALSGVRPHRVHDLGPPGDRAAAQVIAIGEAARQHDEVGAARQLALGVPDRRDPGAGLAQRPRDVAVAVRAGEDDDGGFHGQASAGFRDAPDSTLASARHEPGGRSSMSKPAMNSSA